MPTKSKVPDDGRNRIRHGTVPEDPLGNLDQWISKNIPLGLDRRNFLMRSAMTGTTAVLTGRTVSAQERADRSTELPPEPPPSPTRWRRV